eukprot:CFRG2639T1
MGIFGRRTIMPKDSNKNTGKVLDLMKEYERLMEECFRMVADGNQEIYEHNNAFRILCQHDRAEAEKKKILVLEWKKKFDQRESQYQNGHDSVEARYRASVIPRNATLTQLQEKVASLERSLEETGVDCKKVLPHLYSITSRDVKMGKQEDHDKVGVNGGGEGDHVNVISEVSKVGEKGGERITKKYVPGESPGSGRSLSYSSTLHRHRNPESPVDSPTHSPITSPIHSPPLDGDNTRGDCIENDSGAAPALNTGMDSHCDEHALSVASRNSDVGSVRGTSRDESHKFEDYDSAVVDRSENQNGSFVHSVELFPKNDTSERSALTTTALSSAKVKSPLVMRRYSMIASGAKNSMEAGRSESTTDNRNGKTLEPGTAAQRKGHRYSNSYTVPSSRRLLSEGLGHNTLSSVSLKLRASVDGDGVDINVSFADLLEDVDLQATSPNGDTSKHTHAEADINISDRLSLSNSSSPTNTRRRITNRATFSTASLTGNSRARRTSSSFGGGNGSSLAKTNRLKTRAVCDSNDMELLRRASSDVCLTPFRSGLQIVSESSLGLRDSPNNSTRVRSPSHSIRLSAWRTPSVATNGESVVSKRRGHERCASFEGLNIQRPYSHTPSPLHLADVPCVAVNIKNGSSLDLPTDVQY